jgi:hypothetical protein
MEEHKRNEVKSGGESLDGESCQDSKSEFERQGRKRFKPRIRDHQPALLQGDTEFPVEGTAALGTKNEKQRLANTNNRRVITCGEKASVIDCDPDEFHTCPTNQSSASCGSNLINHELTGTSLIDHDKETALKEKKISRKRPASDFSQDADKGSGGATEQNSSHSDQEVAAPEAGQGILKRIGAALLAVSAVFSDRAPSLTEKEELVTISWRVLFRLGTSSSRPSISPREGEKLFLIIQGSIETNLPTYFDSSLPFLDEGLCEARASLSLPRSQIEGLYYFYAYVNDQGRRLVPNESARIVDIKAADTGSIEIFDDVINAANGNSSLQDLFHHHFADAFHFLIVADFNVDRCVTAMSQRMDVVLGMSLRRSGRKVEKKFGANEMQSIRQIAARWAISALEENREGTRSKEKAQVCFAIFGYFQVSHREFSGVLGSATRPLRKPLYRSIADTFAPHGLGVVHNAYAAPSSILISRGLALLWGAMVSDRFYGWIRILPLLDLDSEEVARVLSEPFPSTHDPADAADFCEAVRTAGLKSGDRAAVLVLKRAPTIGALLEDAVTALGSTADVLHALSSLITSAGQRKNITGELESAVPRFLRCLASAELEWEYEFADELVILLRAVLGAKVDSLKYSCAHQICEVLARISEGCERAHRARCCRLVQIGSKAICDHVEQQGLMRAKPSHKSYAALENELTSHWCCLMKAKVLLDAAAHDVDSRPCPLERNFMVWLGEFQDAEFVSLVSFVMRKMKDTGSNSSTSLAAGVQR